MFFVVKVLLALTLQTTLSSIDLITANFSILGFHQQILNSGQKEIKVLCKSYNFFTYILKIV